MNVLIVDDSPLVCATLSRIMERLSPGVNVTSAPDVISARAAFRLESPDLVFLDMVLADGGSGLAFLPDAQAARHPTRLVLLTGRSREDPEVVSAISQGAYGYVRKPVRVEEIQSLLTLIEQEGAAIGE